MKENALKFHLAFPVKELKNTKLFYIFRTSWVVSSLGKNFFTTMLKLLQKKRELNVINNQFGSPTSSDLIAQKLFLFLDTD